jgi:peptidoglycan/LPS O-acetylase OafA/YrhL
VKTVRDAFLAPCFTLRSATFSGYRADIDGLRAIAVLAIIAFHIDEELLPGGFLGVDLFFVISGFLITGIIYPQIVERRFSFVEFYWRRVKRILPALFVVVAATLLAGLLLLMPDDLKRLAQSAIYSLLSLANLYFYLKIDTGYFADDSAELPLLHLWSLGVEEQFYLLWPLLLVLLAFWLGIRGILVAVAVATVASFVSAEALIPIDPSFGYYMLPTRAGELLAGAMTALFLRSASGATRAPLILQLGGAAGAGLVAWSLAFQNQSMGFPGLSAVPSTFGAVLLLGSGAVGRTIVGRLLSAPPLVAIGVISYSAYLWHWPILAYVRYFYSTVSGPMGLAALVATLLLGALTYLVIERPFRNSKLAPPIGIVRYGVVPVALGVATCLLVLHGVRLGLLLREQDVAARARIKQFSASAWDYEFNCQMSKYDPRLLTDPRCVVGRGGKPSVLVWGDSNAAHYLGMLRVFAEQEGFSLRNVSHSSCPSILGDPRPFVKETSAESCAQFVGAVGKEIGGYHAIAIGSSWAAYDHRPAFREKIAETVAALAATGKTIIILGKVPVFRDYNRKCEARRVRLPIVDCAERSTHVAMTEWEIDNYLRGLADRYPNVTYFDVRNLICNEDHCSAYRNGSPLYFNASHLSMEGSRMLGEAMRAKGEIPDVFRRLGRHQAAAVER